MAAPGIRAGRSRITLGRDLRLLEATGDQLWLEGAVRLRPGQLVELCGGWPQGGGQARVHSWCVVGLSREGPRYRGCCVIER